MHGTDKHDSSATWVGYAFGAIILSCALYIGSYFALLDAPQTYSYGYTYRIPRYRVQSRLVFQVYWPLLAVDFYARPFYWSEDGKSHYGFLD